MERDLYRGKRIDNNEWIFDDLVHTISCMNGIIGYHSLIGIDMEFGEVYPESIGKFIGLEINDYKYFTGEIFSLKMSDGSRLFKIIHYVPQKYGYCIANLDQLHLEYKYAIWENINQNWISEIMLHPETELRHEGNYYDNSKLEI